MIWVWVVHDKISYDSWGYIVGVQIRFVVDSPMMHGDLHKDRKKYKAWIHNFITWWWVTHMLLSTYNTIMMQDSYSSWCSHGWGLLLLYSAIYSMLDAWMITQSCIVGDMMMMISYLYDDRLILTYVDWCRYSQVMILGWYIRSCRFWWDGYGIFHIWYNVNDSVANIDVVDRCLWSRSYIVYDSFWWLSWSYLDVWSML